MRIQTGYLPARLQPALIPPRPVELPEDDFSLRDTGAFAVRTLGAAAAAYAGASNPVLPLAANLGWGLAEPFVAPPMVWRSRPTEVKLSLLRSVFPAAASAIAAAHLGPVAGALTAVGACTLDHFLIRPLVHPGPDHYSTAESRASMGLDSLRAEGLTGRGVTIAFLDTGVSEHPDFEGRLLAYHDAVGGHTEPFDGWIHGTAMVGQALGDGQVSGGRFAGPAPAARAVMARGLGGRQPLESLAQGLEWLLERHQQDPVQVLNLSLGLAQPSTPAQEAQHARLLELVEQCADAGIIVVASAGNHGEVEQLDTLARSNKVITVANYGDGRLADSSSRPRQGKHPDVAAVGRNVVFPQENGRYLHLADGGTSSATAVVSGVIAAWKEEFPQLTLEQAREALRATASPIAGHTFGLLQAGAGLAHLRETPPDPQ